MFSCYRRCDIKDVGKLESRRSHQETTEETCFNWSEGRLSLMSGSLSDHSAPTSVGPSWYWVSSHPKTLPVPGEAYIVYSGCPLFVSQCLSTDTGLARNSGPEKQTRGKSWGGNFRERREHFPQAPRLRGKWRASKTASVLKIVALWLNDFKMTSIGKSNLQRNVHFFKNNNNNNDNKMPENWNSSLSKSFQQI